MMRTSLFIETKLMKMKGRTEMAAVLERLIDWLGFNCNCSSISVISWRVEV